MENRKNTSTPPKFKIFGKQRRELKKKLFLLKWQMREYYHIQDMYNFYENKPIVPAEDSPEYQMDKKRVENLERLLNIPYEEPHQAPNCN
jgi:rRNA maturation protein Nop10